MKNYIDFIEHFFLSLLMISVVFVGSSIFWTSDIPSSQEDMARISLGFPIHFVLQNQSRHDVSFAPEYRHVGLDSLLESPVRILWHYFLLNIVLVQGVSFMALFLIYTAVPSTQKYFKLFSARNVAVGLFLIILVVNTQDIFYFVRYQLTGKDSVYIPPEMYTPVSPMPTPAIPVPQPISH